ncbi:hypothetical protein MUK42_17857 [Musa troglodytarum]|uniref:C2 NT-type domain-containing protein n=1 Tax=Musa troglodytarum TaxID=320322 RepID=A0A9E7KUM0_9LILI|nr:hypothetical protein MUK42_17857 [Musa troglodytarum]
MFKLHRHRSDRFGEKVEFKLSNLQAIKVPRGWEKLFLSIVSVDSGKMIAKTSKSTVRSGNCQWTGTESIWVYQDDASKELEECHFKIVVSPASARSIILGEVTLNVADYLGKEESGPLFLPLKNCDSGTTLQVKIQCVTPKSKFRVGKSWKDTTSHLEDHSNHDDLDSKSDGSDNLFNRNLGSSSSNHLANTSYPEEPGNRETCFSASGSHRSSDSGDSFGRTAFSPKNSSNGGQYIGRLDSSGSQISATYSAGPGDELLRSNPSSFNSRASGSSLHTNHWQDITQRTSNNGLATPSLRPTGSSKDLLEAAEEIDELNDEVKMWERHSRQLKLDLEILKKEISEKSKHQADLDRQLSAAHNERDSLKQEVKHLKAALEESMSNRTDVSNVKNEDMVRVQKELEDELNFQRDSNVNLTQQLKKTQESNIELVAILQELEELTEKQKLELANLSRQNHVDKREGHRSQKSFDNEAEWERKLALKEEEIAILEEKLSNIANNDKMSNGRNPDLIREVEVLKSKLNELERDCAELTDENLDLIFKLKELSKDIRKGNHTHGSRSTEFHDHISSINSEYENGLLISQIHDFEDELIRKEAMCGPLSSKLKDLEKVSADLERELQHYKDEASDLEIRLHQRQKKLEEKDLELCNIQQKIKSSLETGLEGFNAFAVKGFEEVESFGCSDMQNVLSEMDKQIRLALTQARSFHSSDSSGADRACGNDIDITFPGVDRINQKNQIECITKSLHELNALLRENVVRCNPISRGASSGLNLRSSNDTEAPEQLKDESSTAQEPEDEFQTTLLLKEKEIDRLGHSNKELADFISSVQKEKCQLEEDLASLRQENVDNSKYLQDMEHDLLVLTGSVESHVSVNKTLERKSVELESCNKELELHVSELEQENVKLSERISGLEAQLRYLTNEKESNRLELEGTRSLAADLKDEVEQQKAEMEMQKAELKQKLQETQKRLSVALEESDYSSRSNSKLQATIESLIEECSSLQKLNGDLKKQKLEFHERITHLEIELEESKKKNFDFCKQVDLLEIKLSLLQKDVALKEKSLLSQLENIFQDHKEHEERIEKAQSLVNKIELEKTVEVENLRKEMSNLTAQMSSNHDEREKIASDAVHEASVLRSDKVKLECSLQEVNSKVKLYETDLQTLRQESKNKIQGLVDLLNASKQSEEMLMADIDHIQRTMDSVKSSEEKHRKMVNDLELKLKSSDYEKQQVMEESTGLKLQLQKLSELQISVLDLKGSLDEADFEKRKLEELLKSLSEEYEELKAEKVSLTEKVSNMQKALCNSEDDRRSRIVLQEKLLRLESDLSIKEASYAQEAEFKNELNRIKRTNSEYQRKVQSLEQENLELMKKVQIMEKDLMLRKTSCQDVKVCSGDDNKPHSHLEGPHCSKEVHEPERPLLETKHADAVEADNMDEVQHKRVDSGKEADHLLKNNVNESTDRISSLEAELREMKERYLNMSLQYAEVEAQREGLVMQLKSMKKEKRWF